MKKILVMGADTLPGRGIATYLCEQGYEILGQVQEQDAEIQFPVLVDSLSHGVNVPNNSDCIVLAMDYLPFPESVTPSNTFLEAMKKNEERIVELLQMTGGCEKRVIHISTTQVYMEGKLAREESPEYGMNPYGRMKRKVEKLLREAGGIEQISLRIPDIVAKGQSEGWMADVIKKTLRNEDIVTGNLDIVPNFVWLDDLVYFVEKLIEEPRWSYDVVHLVSHRRKTIKELLVEIGKITDTGSYVVVEQEDLYRPAILEDRRAVEMGFASIDYLEMARRMFPYDYLMKKHGWYLSEFEHPNLIAQTIRINLLNLPVKTGRLSMDAYEENYQRLKKKYKKIFISPLICWGISYICYTLYLYTFEHKQQKDELYVFFPHTLNKAIPNMWLIRYCAMKMEVITAENGEFWQYVLNYHSESISVDTSYLFGGAIARGMDYRYRPFSKYFIVEFTAKEEMEAFRRLRLMGLERKEYICFYARDDSWNRMYKGPMYRDAPDSVAEFNDKCRNSNVENYRPALQYMAQKGVYSVRMGAVAERSFEGERIVDYASKYRTEMMDFYLLAHCRFFICTCAGIFSLAMLFRTPMVFVNVTIFTLNMDNYPPLTPQRDLMIPKKYWNTQEMRYLSLREVLAFEREHGDYDIYQQYAERGIEIHENTPEEIADVVREMEERMEGTRFYTEEENNLQARYRDILMDSIEKSYYKWLDARLGTDFLKKNPWFLE